MLSVYETLKKVDNISEREGKINELRRVYNPALGHMFQFAYDPAVQWNLPDGHPPYKPTIYFDQQYALWQKVRMMKHFHVGSDSMVTKVKREQLFVQLLETVSPDDSLVLLAMKDKNLQSLFPSISVSLLNEAFPGLINVIAENVEPVTEPAVMVEKKVKAAKKKKGEEVVDEGSNEQNP